MDVRRRTAIVLSADHGGTGTGHSTATAATNYTVPFFAWGVGRGAHDISPLRAPPPNPASRPDYNASGHRFATAIAATCPSLLGLARSRLADQRLPKLARDRPRTSVALSTARRVTPLGLMYRIRCSCPINSARPNRTESSSNSLTLENLGHRVLGPLIESLEGLIGTPQAIHWKRSSRVKVAEWHEDLRGGIGRPDQCRIRLFVGEQFEA